MNSIGEVMISRVLFGVAEISTLRYVSKIRTPIFKQSSLHILSCIFYTKRLIKEAKLSGAKGAL